MRTLQLVRIILFTCGALIFSTAVIAQCPTSWAVKDECGPITAKGGIDNSTPIFCEGQTITFTNSSDPNLGITKVYIDWGDGVCESFDGNPTTFTHAYDVPDDSCISVPSSVYYIYMAVEKKCSNNKSSFHYIITPLSVSYKPVSSILPPSSICQDEEAIFLNECNTPSNTTTVWVTSDGTTQYGETFTHTFDNPGLHTVVLNTFNGCGSSQDTVQVDVTPTAVALATLSDTLLCLPNAIVTATNQSLYSVGQNWSVTPNSGFVYLDGTGPGSPNPKFKFTVPGNYTIKLVAIGCGHPAWTKTINVNSPPDINHDTIANSCTDVAIDGNDYFTPAGGVATSYQWTFSGANPASFNGANPPSALFTGIGMHAVTLQLSNYCGNYTESDTFYIMPPATANISLSDTTLCIPGDILTVTNNSANAQSYIWWVTPVPWGGFLSGTGATSKNPVFGFSNEGLYTVHLKVIGCGSPKWEGTVKVRRKPVANLINSIEDGCFSVTLDPANYINIGGGMADFLQWNFLGGQPASSNSLVPPIVLFPDTGYHYVQAIVGNMCGTDTLTEDFLIYNPTVVDATTPKDSLCRSANPIQLQAIPNGGFWSGPGVSSTGVFDPEVAIDNAWNQIVYRYGPPGCRIYDTVYIYVMSTAVDAGDPVKQCFNAGSITLSDQTPLGGLWSGLGVTPGGVFNPVTAGVGVHILNYTIIDANGCPNSDNLFVNVLNVPDAVLADFDDACVGVSIDIYDYAAGSTGAYCHWSFGDGATASVCQPQHTYSATGTYDIQLIVTNSAECHDTIQKPITIHDIPVAEIAIDINQGCADLKVQITNNSIPSGNTVYHWEYGDGASDTMQNPGFHIYQQGNNDTTYILELAASNHCGLSVVTEPVTVFPQPIAYFGTNVDDGCTPLTVQFNNVSAGKSKNFRWYINGVLKDTSAQLPPQVFYAFTGDSLYHILLVAENDCGIDSMEQEVIVHLNTVVAFAHLDTTSGCAPFKMRAINFSTDGQYATWDFGDGNTAFGDTVVHTYLQGGMYTIRLFVNNGCGYDTVDAVVTVYGQPLVNFISKPNTCLGDTITFNNLSGALAGCTWQFGDGCQDLTTASPTHIYTTPGQYQVTMIGFAVSTGCPDTLTRQVKVLPLPDVAIKLDQTSGCEPYTIAPINTNTGNLYTMWDFGDGGTSTEIAPLHTYQKDGQFLLNIKVVDEFGCSNDTSMFPISVYPIPDLSFNLQQGPLCTTPVTLTFTNTSAHGDAYVWTFGNGMSSTDVNPVFTLPSGPLGIVLNGSNMYGCTAVLDTQVNIYSEPITQINLDQTSGCAPFAIVLDNTSIGVNHFQWTFGDGQSSALANPVHTFHTPGEYRVRLVADNDGICFDSNEVLIHVMPSPKAGFTAEVVTDTLVSSTGIYNFTDASVGAAAWNWDFGDGSTSDVQDPVHRYLINGEKTITLVVVNEYECRDTAWQKVKPQPFGNLFVPNSFSPELGADGAREFRPVGTGLSNYKMNIYASNGQLVWTSEELSDGQPVSGWDGTFMGELCPPGIYWWKCTAILSNGNAWPGMSFAPGEKPIREGKLLLVR